MSEMMMAFNLMMGGLVYGIAGEITAEFTVKTLDIVTGNNKMDSMSRDDYTPW